MFEQIGTNAVAVVQGMPQTEGYTLPRQHNTFYYLSGIETPGVYLLLDGRTKKVTIYLPNRNSRLEAAEGRVLSAEDGELVKRISGVDQVLSLRADGWHELAAGVATGDTPAAGGQPRRRAGHLRASSAPPKTRDRAAASSSRPRPPAPTIPGMERCLARRRFVELLRVRQPRADLRNLTPILDEMRSIKSPREIAMIRRASQIAGLGLMEAMRSTEPGVTEYQLDAAARYVFLVNDARLEGYRSITASGTENINNMHYFRNTGTAKGRATWC